MIKTDERYLTFGNIINQLKLTVNIHTLLDVFFIWHIGTTENQVTIISGLGVLEFYKLVI